MKTVTATPVSTPTRQREAPGHVYCYMCTHTVPAMVTYTARSAKVTPGQKCTRCSASLDSAFVFGIDRAA